MNANSLDEVRAYVATLADATLLDVIEDTEPVAPTDEGTRIVYAVACAAMSARLGAPAADVAASPLGPAEYLRLVHSLRSR